MDLKDLIGEIPKKVQEEEVSEKDIQKEEKKPLMYAVIYFPVLGEDVQIVMKREYLEAARADYPGLIIYTPKELEVLLERVEKEHFRVVHQMKKRFRGWILKA